MKMIDFKLILERERLEKAVDLFAAAMKAELVKRAKEGKRGWDQPDLSEPYVVRQMRNDAVSVDDDRMRGHRQLPLTADPQLVAIANRCAILWFRHNRPQTETKPESKENDTHAN